MRTNNGNTIVDGGTNEARVQGGQRLTQIAQNKNGTNLFDMYKNYIQVCRNLVPMVCCSLKFKNWFQSE